MYRRQKESSWEYSASQHIYVSFDRTLDFNDLEKLPADLFKGAKFYDLWVIKSGLWDSTN